MDIPNIILIFGSREWERLDFGVYPASRQRRAFHKMKFTGAHRSKITLRVSARAMRSVFTNQFVKLPENLAIFKPRYGDVRIKCTVLTSDTKRLQRMINVRGQLL